VLRHEEDAIASNWFATAQGRCDPPRRDRHGLRDELLERRESLAALRRGRHRDHQPYRSLVLRRQELALDVRRSELRLEIHQSALDLDVDDLRLAGQDQVRRPRVARGDRNFEARAPAGMGRTHDRLRQRHLPGVTEAHTRDRIEPPGQACPQAAASRHRASRETSSSPRSALLTSV
jgi:hypothetical protein